MKELHSAQKEVESIPMSGIKWGSENMGNFNKKQS